MTRKLILAAALAASLLSGGVAFAQPGPQSPQAMGRDDGPPPPRGGGNGERRAFARADRNGDGIVSRQEYLAAATRRFDKLDRDHDGRLTAAEMTRGGGHRGGRGMRRGGGDDMAPPPPPRDYQ